MCLRGRASNATGFAVAIGTPPGRKCHKLHVSFAINMIYWCLMSFLGKGERKVRPKLWFNLLLRPESNACM